jgi:hypothetical protein
MDAQMDPRTLTLAITRALYEQSERFRAAVELELAPGKSRRAREANVKRISALLGRACNVGMSRLSGSVAIEARADKELDSVRAELKDDPALRAAVRTHLPLLAAIPRPGAPRLARLTRDVLTSALRGLDD